MHRKIFVDANGAYSAKQAIEMAHHFADYGVNYFEEPVSSDHLDQLALVRQHAPMQVAVGTDLLAITGNAMSGTIGHVLAGDIHVTAILRMATPLIAGGLVGSQLGARACVIFSQARLRLIFNALLVSATLYMGGAGLGLITAVSSKG